MQLRLEPGEQVIVATLPQARTLFWPFLALLLVLLAGGFGSGRITRELGVAWVAQWQPFLQAAVLVAAAVLALRLFVVPLLRWSSTRYVLTNRRLLVRRGWGRRSEQETRLSGICEVHAEQSLLQRMLRSGTLRAEAGPGRSTKLVDVPEVYRFRTLVARAIEDLPQPAAAAGTGPLPQGPALADGSDTGLGAGAGDPGDDAGFYGG
ncbi:PH domain-containing protein [Arthrobacter sp. I2-34]|uniref:PH domain-containing protein n=1 Tax=Arthrobacter hankyongi TaxID=2904801 RepID=A0ABS9L198_9MICC|nr:PH domain-containing protein [Arthrobacter hankyongi]MCG2620472.1 PH domain-containing protein [Arthrobacter hankyongi]